MDEFEKPINDYSLLRVSQKAKHSLLGELVQRHYHQSNQSDPRIGALWRRFRRHDSLGISAAELKVNPLKDNLICLKMPYLSKPVLKST
jgi:hypothetical protein